MGYLIGFILAIIPGLAIADPVTVAVVAGAASAASTYFVVGATLGVAIAAGVVAAGVTYYSAKQAQDIPSLSSTSLATEAQSRTQMVRQAITNRRVIYGKAKVSGPIIYMTTTGSDDILHLIVAIAGHEVDGYDAFYIGDEEVTFDIDPEQGLASVNAGKYSGDIKLQAYRGTDTQLANANLVSEVTEWTNDHTLSGVAYIYCRMDHNTTDFQGGNIPEVRCVVRGKKVTDIRSGKSYGTDNPAMCLRDFLLDDKYGFGAQNDEIDETSFIAAANVCDERVSLWLKELYGASAPDISYVGDAGLTRPLVPQSLFYNATLGNNNTTISISTIESTWFDGSGQTSRATQVLGTRPFQTGQRIRIYDGGSTGSIPSPLDNLPQAISFRPDSSYVGNFTNRFGGASFSDYLFAIVEDSAYEIKVATSLENARQGIAFNIGDYTAQTYGLIVEQIDELRYTCNGVIDTEQSPKTSVQKLLNSFLGELSYTNGKFFCIAPTFEIPTVTYDENDLRGNVTISPNTSFRDKFNAVKGIIVDPQNQWQPTDYEPVTSLYENADGSRIFQDVAFDFTISRTMASRMALQLLKDARQEMIVNLPMKITGMKSQIGDTIKLQLPTLGFADKSSQPGNSVLRVFMAGSSGTQQQREVFGLTKFQNNLLGLRDFDRVILEKPHSSGEQLYIQDNKHYTVTGSFQNYAFSEEANLDRIDPNNPLGNQSVYNFGGQFDWPQPGFYVVFDRNNSAGLSSTYVNSYDTFFLFADIADALVFFDNPVYVASSFGASAYNDESSTYSRLTTVQNKAGWGGGQNVFNPITDGIVTREAKEFKIIEHNIVPVGEGDTAYIGVDMVVRETSDVVANDVYFPDKFTETVGAVTVPLDLRINSTNDNIYQNLPVVSNIDLISDSTTILIDENVPKDRVKITWTEPTNTERISFYELAISEDHTNSFPDASYKFYMLPVGSSEFFFMPDKWDTTTVATNDEFKVKLRVVNFGAQKGAFVEHTETVTRAGKSAPGNPQLQFEIVTDTNGQKLHRIFVDESTFDPWLKYGGSIEVRYTLDSTDGYQASTVLQNNGTPTDLVAQGNEIFLELHGKNNYASQANYELGYADMLMPGTYYFRIKATGGQSNSPQNSSYSELKVTYQPIATGHFLLNQSQYQQGTTNVNTQGEVIIYKFNASDKNFPGHDTHAVAGRFVQGSVADFSQTHASELIVNCWANGNGELFPVSYPQYQTIGSTHYIGESWDVFGKQDRFQGTTRSWEHLGSTWSDSIPSNRNRFVSGAKTYYELTEFYEGQHELNYGQASRTFLYKTPALDLAQVGGFANLTGEIKAYAVGKYNSGVSFAWEMSTGPTFVEANGEDVVTHITSTAAVNSGNDTTVRTDGHPTYGDYRYVRLRAVGTQATENDVRPYIEHLDFILTSTANYRTQTVNLQTPGSFFWRRTSTGIYEINMTSVALHDFSGGGNGGFIIGATASANYDTSNPAVEYVVDVMDFHNFHGNYSGFDYYGIIVGIRNGAGVLTNNMESSTVGGTLSVEFFYTPD
jgi:hypothetical protein